MSPPCSTFGCRRNDGGPPPLRGISKFEIYGFSNLHPDDAEKVKLGTLLALRSAEVAKLCLSLSVPWLVEQPLDQTNRPHMFMYVYVARVARCSVIRVGY